METWCACESSLLAAAIQRTTKTKGMKTVQMLDFINFAKKWIKKNLPKGQAPYMSRVELF